MLPSLSAEHLQTLDVVRTLELLRSSQTGLTDEEAARRRAAYGSNELAPAVRRHWPRMLARQFLNFFSLLLDVSALLCFLADWLRPGEGMLVLGWALLGVALLNGFFAFAQEYRAERAMEELRKLLPQRVRVRRQGTCESVLASELVRGDILLIEAGERVPADSRLIAGNGIQVSNAPLTGESRPIALHAGATSANGGADASNLLLAGCVVLRGQGEAVVYATGHDTQFGRVARLSVQTRRPPSPLELEVARMSRVLTAIATTMGIAFFAYGVLSGQSLLHNLVFMMGIIVANVPEGLLPTLTLALSMGSLRMARKQVLVKSLPAVEALGAMHIICTDKTGTLTADQLALVGAYGGEVEPLDGVARRELLRLALIASDVRESETGSWSGDPLDVAVAECFEQAGGVAAEIVRETYGRIPFDARLRRQMGRWSSTRIASTKSLLVVKGAWEALRPYLSRRQRLLANEPRDVDDSAMAQIESHLDELAQRGYRLIAIAFAEADERDDRSSRAKQDDAEAIEPERWAMPRLTLAGFLAWEDPVRPEVPRAIEQCQAAGIRVLMVTGDHPQTATAVARQIGLVAPTVSASDATLTGADLERLADDQIVRRVEQGTTIFARTTPEQKLKIVNALKRQHEVVGMTGDGVNDAPALKAADVGIAMGRGGTDVAREAADVILLDNNFASIVAGVEEGRAIFRNIRRFTDYVLASNVPEIVPYLLYILFPIPLALTIVQILAIDLGTDILPAIGLGQEPPEPDIMRRPPRRRDERLLSWDTLRHAYLFFGPMEALVSLGLFFYVLVQGGWAFGDRLEAHDPLYRSATTMALASVVFLQMGNLIGRRSDAGSGFDRGLGSNRLVVLGLAVELVFVVSLFCCPPLQRVLGTSTVPNDAMLLALIATPVVFAIDYVVKRRKK